MRYFDSSVVLKLYVPEPNSELARTFVQDAGQPPVLTRLHLLELKTAARQKLGRGELSASELQKVLADFDSDLIRGLFREASLDWAAVFARAESLSRQHAAATLCRTLDTLHVAIALELGATEFCTVDKRQAAMARLVGLIIVPVLTMDIPQIKPLGLFAMRLKVP